jgi:YL1 nuclear protein C-terminal domain
MSQNAQRKAWNDAMLAAAGTATSLVPSSLKPQSRRSDRRKRRDKARTTSKNMLYPNSIEDEEYRCAVWMDALEQAIIQQDDGEEEKGVIEEEEYNELDDLEGPNKRKQQRIRKNTKAKVGKVPKRFKARSLASILHEEESTQHDSIARDFIQAGLFAPDPLPARPFCPVTGLLGLYKDPKTGIPYANERALEQIQERVPPWKNLSSGTAAYHEVVKSLLSHSNKKVK